MMEEESQKHAHAHGHGRHAHAQVSRRGSAVAMAERVNRAQQGDSREKTLQVRVLKSTFMVKALYAVFGNDF